LASISSGMNFLKNLKNKVSGFKEEFKRIRLCCMMFPIVHMCNVWAKDLMYVNNHYWNKMKLVEKLKWWIAFIQVTALFYTAATFSYIVALIAIVYSKMHKIYKMLKRR